MSDRPQLSDAESARLQKLGLAVVRNEAAAVTQLESRIDQRFAQACHHLLACDGRIVVIGMGKSGHIGSKIAATLASTGSPAFFVHPGEASHGDLGMITAKDVVMAISNSGETSELLTILPLIKRLGVPLITMTGRSDSNLARQANVNIDISVTQEACPLNLAPTSSTTASLVMGDALAIALLEARGFTEEDFARAHPGGMLGRRLLLHIGDIMHSGDAMPQVRDSANLPEALLEMTNKGLGMTTVIDSHGCISGVFTDGDLRRILDSTQDIRDCNIIDVMTRNFQTAQADMLAAEALQILQDKKINALPIVDDTGRLTGVIAMHDLLRAGVV